MEDGTPTLEVGFAINTGGAFAEILRFSQMFDAKTVEIVRQVADVEKATGGMIKLSGATAAMTSFGGTAKRELEGVRQAATATGRTLAEVARDHRALAREKASTERQAEALIRTLEREASTLGRTKEEIRAAKVEQLALNAAQQGNTDIADRLLAAARKRQAAAEAVAEAEQAAAQKAQAANAAVEQSLRSASHAHEMFQARVRQGVAEMAAADREAAAFEATMARVQGRVDPAAVSIGKLKTELDEAKLAFDRGRIGAETFEQEQARITGAAGRLYGPQRQLAGAITEVGMAQRFTAMETLNLSRQFQDIGVTAAMGMNPLMIAVQQGPQIYDVLEQVRARGVSAGAALKQMGADVLAYGVTGYGKLLALLTPTNLLLAGTAVAAIAVARALGSYGAAMQRFETTAAGVGRTSGQTAAQMEAIAEAAASTSERSLAATRDSTAAFAAAGIQGATTLTQLSANVERYAKLTGQDVPAAQAALASAMADPAQAADTFTQQLGLLTGAQYAHIQQLAAQGREEEATAELTRILTRDLAANADQATGVAKVMDVLGGAVSGVAVMFGRLDQKIKNAAASYDAWLKQRAGSWAVDLFGTGNKEPAGPNAAAGRNQDQIAALNASDSLNTGGMKQINDLIAKRTVLMSGLRDTTGLTAEQVRGLRHDFTAVTDTLNANRSATGGWITTQERAHLVAQAQAKLASARTQADKAAAQQQITRLQLGTQVLTQTERQTQATDAYNKVASRYVKPKVDRQAETLARDIEATEAQIRNLNALGAAYGVSNAAAFIAEARTKAESQAIKQKNGDLDAAIDRQLRLAIAQRAADAARSAAAIGDEARIQTEVNTQVAAGLVPAERANELVRERVADLSLLAAAEAATKRASEAAKAGDVARQVEMTKAAEQATAALKAQQDARAAAKAAEIGAFYTGADQQADRQLAVQREELRLVGATEEARAGALAKLQAEQTLAAKGYALGTTYADNYIAKQVQIAVGAVQLAQRQEEVNAALGRTAELFDVIDQSVQRAAQGMSDAFGSVGATIGDVVTVMSGYYAEQARLQQTHDAAMKKAQGNQKAVAHEQRLYAIRSSSLQIGAYGDMAAAAKGFFKEGSAGYKALSAAEKVYRVAQLAMSVQAMVQQVRETVTHVASAAARSTANAAEGVSAQSKLPFPANIAAMAATAAALVAAGISVFGGGGGTKSAPITNTGTGSVLGDRDAKSESIKNAIDALQQVDLLMLSSSRQMATSLRSIDSQIGGLASVLVRSGNIDANSSVAQGFKSDAIGSVLSKIPLIGGFLGGLFGSKTTVKGSGLFAGGQTIADILGGGFDAQTYSDVEKTKKFLGVTTSKKTSTVLGGAVDASVSDQFALILRSFNDAIVAAAGPLGASTADIAGRVSSFVFDLGKVDLSGLTGAEIEERLAAVFGAAADKMAGAAFPGIERFQKVGEGAFETLVRVSSTVEAVTAALDGLGASSRALGIDAKMGLAGQFDTVSDLTSAVDGYFQAFYTSEEQAAAKAAQFGRVFESLGLAMPATLDGFRGLVEAQDLTTAAGQSTYATLLQLAPAFADLKASMDGAKSAADILSERQDLQRKLLELNGDTQAIRALDLMKVDASNRALQQQVWALSDAQEAAKSAQALAEAWSSVGDSIMDEVKRIRGLSDAGGGSGFATIMGQFNAATAAARGGDQDAAKSLPAISQALLKAAADQATSRQELARIQAQTASSLEDTYGVISALNRPAPSAATGSGEAADSSVEATPASTAGNETASEIRELRKENADMRRDLQSGLATIAENTRQTARVLGMAQGMTGGPELGVIMYNGSR